MTPYELSNINRAFLGLSHVEETWTRTSLNETVVGYFNKDKIVKIIDYKYGYLEYDTEINTINKNILLPKTSKGKERKMTVQRILKIKGSGIQFSGSFHGGGINVYDNKRNVTFIRSFLEDGQISSYKDITNWVNKYVAESSSNYFGWLKEQLNSKRLNVNAKQGDIIAFPIGRYEYGFARVLVAGFLSPIDLFGKTLLISPYSYISQTVDINFDALLKYPTLKPIQINDAHVFYGEYPIVSHRLLSGTELTKIQPSDLSKYMAIPHSKTDLIQMIDKW
ncbi:Imm26 family immunity protein [Limnovirga soli]|uniref:Uncharacterized protein n=1 Tax=Limnovirga soli TaxID=2656915 RepID=A0A8J8FGG2_9BACT|nr:Imm26 family immunity protein [Limnovirga soli]NNV56513.1 hypothetical protein [Limnovirga soli]